MQEEIHIAENNHPRSFRITETTNCAFIPHVHAHPELIYVISGRLLSIVNGERRILEAGDLCLTFSNRLHSFEELSPCRCFYCTFGPELTEDFGLLMKAEQYDCVYIRSTSPRREISATMQALLDEWHGTRNQMVMIGYLQVLLGRIHELSTPQPSQRQMHPTALRVVTYLCEHFLEPITLEGVADAIGISKHHLSRLCNNEIGYGFNAYINYLRMAVARQMLLQTLLPIGEVAKRCGCGSLRTFNRVFFENTGMSPRAFRKNPPEQLSNAPAPHLSPADFTGSV